MHIFPVFLVLLLVFFNRYLFGLFLRKLKGSRFDRVREDFEPTVTIITPLFNEGSHIYGTIKSLLKAEYPPEKLNMIVVDDCSTDDSYEWAMKAAAEHPGRVTVLRNAQNMGKRLSIGHAVEESRAEVVISVDSDVVVDPKAVRRLVQRFTSPDIAAVGGRVLVSNANENWLTRMQAIKYYFGYEFLKNLERSFQTVMCLSGCLTAYRRHVLLELDPILRNRNILAVPIRYGEDRFLTRQIVKAGYRTVLTLDAICFTVAPATLNKYFLQQLRWRRSNIVDFLGGVTHVWALHPAVSLHYFSLYALMLAYPVVIMENILNGAFFDLLGLHCAVLSFLGVVYALSSRHIPQKYRVGPIWFVAMAVVMPVTYVLLTPLALFTLDNSLWETRSAAPSKPVQTVPAGQRSVSEVKVAALVATPRQAGAPARREVPKLHA